MRPVGKRIIAAMEILDREGPSQSSLSAAINGFVVCGDLDSRYQVLPALMMVRAMNIPQGSYSPKNVKHITGKLSKYMRPAV